MKRITTILLASALTILSGVIAPTAQAVTYYWDGVTGNWDTLANWGTIDGNTGSNPTVVPLASAPDTLVFNSTGVNGAETIYLNGNRGTTTAQATLQFSNTGATTLLGGVSGTPANNQLYVVGITLNSGAGAATIGDTAASPTAKVDLMAASMTIANNDASSLLTIANGLRSYGTGSTTAFTFNGIGSTTVGGLLQNGTGTNVVRLQKDGTGTLTLSIANTFSGGMTISAGTVAISNKSALGTGGLWFNGGALQSTTPLTGANKISNTITLTTNSGTISGSNALELGGTLTISGASRDLYVNNTTTLSGNIYLSESAVTGRTLTLRGSGALFITGPIANYNGSGTAGSLTINTSGTVTLSGGSSYTGKTTLSAGTVVINNNAAFGNSATVALNGVTLDNTSGSTRTLANVAYTLAGINTYTGTGGAILNMGTGTMDLNGSTRTWVVDGGNLIIGGVISGATTYGLNKNGAGTLTLSGANTYSGTTTVNNGRLVLTVDLALQNSAFDTASAGTLDLTGVNNPTLGGLTGSTAFTPPVNVVSLTLNNVSGVSLTYSGVLGGSANIIKTGINTQNFTGNNNYTGNTVVNAGVLNVGTNNALGSNAGTTSVASTGALVLGNGVNVASESVTISGSGTASSGVNFNGALQVNTGGSATWGGTIILGSSDARIGAQTGGTLTVTGDIQASGVNTNLSVGSGASVNNGATVILAGSQKTYSGNTSLVRGVLKLGAPDVLPSGTVLDVHSANTDAATFDLNGYSQTIGGLKNTGTGSTWSTVQNSAVGTSRVLTIGVSGAGSYSYGGIIQNGGGTLSLTKSGLGTQVLRAADTYTGATLINNGTLALGAGGSIVNSATIDVAASAYFDVSAVAYTLGSSQTLQGNGTVVGPVTANGTVAPGTSVGTLTFSSSFTLANTGTLSLELVGNNMDQIIVGGNLTLNGTINFTDSGTHTSNAYVFALYTGALDTTGVTVTGVPTGYTVDWNYLGLNNQAAIVIPEPSALALVGLGLVGLLATSRWFRRKV